MAPRTIPTMDTLLLWRRPDGCGCFPILVMTKGYSNRNALHLRMAHKKGRGSKSLPLLERATRETPYQDYNRIKKMIQAKSDTKVELEPEDLFVDASFPPDKSSLTYVYSGDDKYEQAIFLRPKEIKEEPAFTGVGGICDQTFPWQQWKQRGWFQAALVVMSLHVRALERLIPGFRNNEQNFYSDYIGCFHFHIWRFGEWVDIVVDDHLPVLDSSLLFTQPLGAGEEMWGPLVEKAYAKCKKTFQAIEYGVTLDALTDLTAGVCEFYSPDVNAPSNLFHVVYKSAVNRSFMTCWRNNKRLTSTGFSWDNDSAGTDQNRYLHLITAVTKFSTSGGRLEQMLRLKCPYKDEPKWKGRFSDGDTVSWKSVNSEFMSRLQPQTKKDNDEYWITFEDFRCNFGGLFIVSTSEPFRLDGFNIHRTYRTHSDVGLMHNHSPQWFTNGYTNRERRSTAPHEAFVRDFTKLRNCSDSDNAFPRIDASISAPSSPQKPFKERKKSSDSSFFKRLTFSRDKHNSRSRPESDDGLSSTMSELSESGESSPTGQYPPYQQQMMEEINENDIIPHEASKPSTPFSFVTSARRRKSTGEKLKETPSPSEKNTQSDTSKGQLLRKTPKSNFIKKHSLDAYLHGYVIQSHFAGREANKGCGTSMSADTFNSMTSSSRTSSIAETPDESISSIFNVSQSSPVRQSTTDSCFSSSEISVHMAADEFRRPQSAPTSRGYQSDLMSNSISSLTQSSFLATKADFFRSDGRWRLILEHRDSWSKEAPSSDRTHIDAHSRTQRIYFLVTRNELRDPLLPPTLQEKRHVLISLIQDYRHGASTANSFLVPIGFCLYKTKHSDRDEKRHISKLQLIGQVDGEPDRREVNARFDLDPGGYFIVPYYQADVHSGEFILRVLTESDLAQSKSSCKIS